MNYIILNHAYKRLGECEVGSRRFMFWNMIVDGVHGRMDNEI